MAWEGNVLALDLASRTGWAYGPPGGEPRSGSVRFGPEGAQRPRVIREARQWLEAFVTVNPVRLCVFEAPALPMHMAGHTNKDVIRLLIGLVEAVDEMLFDRVDVREATVAEVRRFFLGSARIKSADAKAQTVFRCSKLGWKPVDHNAADALALWAYQTSIVAPDPTKASFAPLFG